MYHSFIQVAYKSYWPLPLSTNIPPPSQDNRGGAELPRFCQGLQLPSGLPNEPGEQMQRVVAVLAIFSSVPSSGSWGIKRKILNKPIIINVKNCES